jgi:hypothetical protein
VLQFNGISLHVEDQGAAGRSPWCTDGRILPTSGANRSLSSSRTASTQSRPTSVALVAPIARKE